MHRTSYIALLACALFLTACDEGTGPDADGSADIDYILDADFERTDTSVVVNDEDFMMIPSINESVRMYRYLTYGFGGFPQAGYELGYRVIDFWGFVVTSREEPVLRNDSTILSYVDHGTLTLGDVSFTKETSLPIVSPGQKIAYENFVQYSVETFARTVWVGGEVTQFVHLDIHDDLLAGDSVLLASTGSAHAHPAGDSIALVSVATLTGMENGEEISLDVDAAPQLSAADDLVLEFDNALDPDRAFLRIMPLSATAGARSVFIELERATKRVVIPASLLATLVEEADEAVPYFILIEEYAVRPNAFTGTRPGAASFELPMVQAAETTLHVWIEP